MMDRMGCNPYVNMQILQLQPYFSHFFRDLYNVTMGDIVLQASPLTFDPSAVEMFTTLSRGASLLLVPEFLKMIPSQLAQIISVRHVTTIIQVGKYPTLHSVKQKFIPVGCVPRASVCATRCQCWVNGRPPRTETAIPLDRDPPWKYRTWHSEK